MKRLTTRLICGRMRFCSRSITNHGGGSSACSYLVTSATSKMSRPSHRCAISSSEMTIGGSWRKSPTTTALSVASPAAKNSDGIGAIDASSRITTSNVRATIASRRYAPVSVVATSRASVMTCSSALAISSLSSSARVRPCAIARSSSRDLRARGRRVEPFDLRADPLNAALQRVELGPQLRAGGNRSREALLGERR